MEFRCRICGGQVQVDRAAGVCICEYCGTKQSIPLFSDDSSKRLYESGNNYLQHCEYDKAENVFNQLLSIDPQDAEIYWDLVMCKYGVTFVCDPRTGKYIPTCNRTHYDSVLNDKNYLNALKLSTGDKKEFYQESAETINSIQKGIISVAKKEKPFDIFISYKETDRNGNRTKDSIVAQELYEKLVSAGYKVFFSRITLEDKIGSEYEPYIYAALSSSKVMLTVSSSNENIESPWVKNEWSRFLMLRQADSSKAIVPLYFSMQKSELPEEFAILSAQDIGRQDYEQDLIRGIKKLIPLPITKAKRRKNVLRIVGAVIVSLTVILGAVVAIMIPKELEKKRIDEENAAKEESYSSATILFENADYTAAAEAFDLLGDYKDSLQMLERCHIQPDYDTAMRLYYDGNYPEAAWAFGDLGDYEDAPEMQKKAELSWRKSLSTVYTGNYYITENGTVAAAKGTVGNKHSDIDISKNGKVVSIIENNMYGGYSEHLTVLHENGGVSYPEALADNPEWHDIIKVSQTLQWMGMVGLRADGKMVFYGRQRLSELLTGISEWDNIVDFNCYFEGGEVSVAGLLMGLKSDGTFCTIEIGNDETAFETEEAYDMEAVENILSDFNNVKKFAFLDKAYDSDFGIVALSHNGKLLTYSNGYYEISVKGFCDIISNEIALKTNGDLVELNSGKVLLKDIVYAGRGMRGYLNGYYAVTRNGNITHLEEIRTWDDAKRKRIYGGVNIQQTDNKTTVYEEWVKRLN